MIDIEALGKIMYAESLTILESTIWFSNFLFLVSILYYYMAATMLHFSINKAEERER